MKTQPNDTHAAFAAFSSRVNLSENHGGEYWRNRLEIHLSKESTENAIALATVEFVANLVSRSLTGTRDKRQSRGGHPDAGGLAVPLGQSWRETLDCLIAQSTRAKRGKRQPITLSETDKAEISGIVGLVLASRNAFSRPLNREDVGECFRMVEGRKGLDLNRRWRPLPDSQPTLAQLALPEYDKETDAERLERLRERLEQIESCIAAMERVDLSRKAVSKANGFRRLVIAIVTRTQSGNGLSKAQERSKRAELASYLKQGAIALRAESISSAPWQFDLVRALESFQSENITA
jgi:hypothetical protein